jgi:hypothetical protein
MPGYLNIYIRATPFPFTIKHFIMETHEPDILLGNGAAKPKEEKKVIAAAPGIVRKPLSPKAGKAVEDTPVIPSNFTEAIYDAITKAYASKNPSQMFCLNWPGTILDYEHLKWDRSEETAGNMPEYALIRSSLILDQYVPPSPITQPDGTRVSDRYKQAIGQVGPIPNKELLKLQQIIRTRLNKTVTVEINGKEREMRLVDWFSHLNQKWTNAKRQWGEKQQAMMDQFQAQYPFDKNLWWDAYLKWYELNADAWINKINAAYEELIIEFPLTAWQDAIAIVDTSDNAGLTNAKAAVRNMSMPIPYQEGVSYVPAQGVPYSWPLELRPSTGFIDFLADPEMQQMQLETAITQIRQQIMAWMAIIPQIDDEQVKSDTDAFNKAQQDYSDAQGALIKQYTDNVVTAVQIFCDIMASRTQLLSETPTSDQPKVTTEINDLGKGLADSKKLPYTPVDWNQIKDIAVKVGEGNNSLIDKQQALVDSGRVLAGAATKFLQDEANRSRFSWLQSYVSQLENQLDYLQQQLKNRESAANVYYNYASTPGDFGSDANISKLDSPDNIRWSEMKIQVSADQLKSDKTMNTYFSQMQWGVDLFLGSAGGSYENSGAYFAENFMEAGSDISIGFLACKVLIERPWMQPEVFLHSNNFFRTVSTRISPEKAVTANELIKDEKKVLEMVNNYSLPAYPTALLLVKDVCVRVKLKVSETNTVREMEKSVKSQGGGFLCFSISRSEASSSERESLNSYFMAGEMVSRAPAPQIIGYWVQFMPPDLSKELTEAQAKEITESLGFLNDLSMAHNTGEAIKQTPQQPQ